MTPPHRHPTPGFLVIGAMKAGTTTLHRWLDAHPDVAVSAVKELDHLQDPAEVARGVDAYLDRLPLGEAPVVGESSPAYLSPSGAPVAAETISRWFPDTPLIVVLRDPLERALSHFDHQVRRARERRPVDEAMRDPASPYVAGSRYAALLQHYLDHRLRDRLLVTSLERLTAHDEGSWHQVLDHVGLDRVDRPDTRFNTSADKDAFTPAMRMLYDRGLHGWANHVPPPIRRVARRVLLRRTHPSATSAGSECFTEQTRTELLQDGERLQEQFGLDRLPWQIDGD